MTSRSSKTGPTEFALLDKEQIAKRRIPLEDSMVIASSKQGNWLCGHCNQRFHSETRYMKHVCEPKRRAGEIKSPLGQAAYNYYREWMRLKHFNAPNISAFVESKFYRSFINFAQLVIDANISRPEKFMELMVEADVLPILWCREQCYSIYLEWMDKLHDPLDQVQDSINYLMDICEREEMKLGEVFEKLGAQRVLSLVRQRRLSPWLLFCAPSFGRFLKTIDKEQLKVFNTVVNAQFWSNRFQQERATIENIKTIVKGIGL